MARAKSNNESYNSVLEYLTIAFLVLFEIFIYFIALRGSFDTSNILRFWFWFISCIIFLIVIFWYNENKYLFYPIFFFLSIVLLYFNAGDLYILLFNYFFKQPTSGQWLVIVSVYILVSISIAVGYGKNYKIFGKTTNYYAILLLLILISFAALLVRVSTLNFYISQESSLYVSLNNGHYVQFNCQDENYSDFVLRSHLNCSITINGINEYKPGPIKICINSCTSPEDDITANITQNVLLPVKNTTNLSVNLTLTNISNKSDVKIWSGSNYSDIGLYEFFTKKEYDDRLNNKLLFVAGFFVFVITLLYYSKDFVFEKEQ